MVTIRDIALKSGFSVSTVSKALNGYSDVSEETRQIIIKTARELGYVPNAQARALKTNRTFILGILFTDDQNNGLTHLYFSHVLNGFKNKAEESGYNITFINKRWGKQTITLLQNCKFRGIEGICIACIDVNDPEVQELVYGGIPLVSIDHIFKGHPCVLSNNKEDISLLIKYAYSLGHRKIAYIHGNNSSFVTQQRVKGYVETMKELGLQPRQEYMIESLYVNPSAARSATEKLLKLPDRPTCILLPDDVSAFGALDAITDAGLKIPEDISIAGYDGVLVSELMNPRLTTIKQNVAKIGEEAARLLIHTIENKKNPILEPVIVEGELIIRDSIGHVSKV